MYSKEQPQHLKKLIKFKKLREDSFNPQWNQVHYYHTELDEHTIVQF